jgi:hypothetical protein
MPLSTAEASNEKASVRKILEHYMDKQGKDQEFCDVAKIELVLAGSQKSSACNSICCFKSSTWVTRSAVPLGFLL